LKFKNKGYQVETVTGGAEALQKMRDNFNPDIIMLDIIMPSIDGIEVVETMRKEKLSPNATIVMLTNQGDKKDIERSKKLGVHGYIVKATTIPSEVVEEVGKIASKNKK